MRRNQFLTEVKTRFAALRARMENAEIFNGELTVPQSKMGPAPHGTDPILSFHYPTLLPHDQRQEDRLRIHAARRFRVSDDDSAGGEGVLAVDNGDGSRIFAQGKADPAGRVCALRRPAHTSVRRLDSQPKFRIGSYCRVANVRVQPQKTRIGRPKSQGAEAIACSHCQLVGLADGRILFEDAKQRSPDPGC